MPATCPECGEPEPCSCVACPQCTALAPHRELGHACSACDWNEARCETCGGDMVFAPDYRGQTTGGLAIVGARACIACGIFEVCRRSRPADALEWTLAKGGRSLNAGGIRVRAESAAPGDVEAVMARIARVPFLEVEVERLKLILARRQP